MIDLLKNQEADIIPLPNFIKLDDVRMIKLMQNVNFIDECLEIFDLFLLDGFNCKLLASLSIFSKVNESKAPIGKFLNKMILVLDIGLVAGLEHLLFCLHLIQSITII